MNAWSGHRFVGGSVCQYKRGSCTFFCFCFSLSWLDSVSSSPEWWDRAWIAASHFGSCWLTLLGWDGNQQEGPSAGSGWVKV